jgi:hypothetical protein
MKFHTRKPTRGASPEKVEKVMIELGETPASLEEIVVGLCTLNQVYP